MSGFTHVNVRVVKRHIGHGDTNTEGRRLNGKAQYNNALPHKLKKLAPRADHYIPSASTSFIISCSSASVGFWPRDLMTVPNSLVVIVPSPSLSNNENASLNSAICSSVNWSAYNESKKMRVLVDD